MSTMVFHKVSIDDREEFNKYALSAYMQTCDCTFANVITWADTYDTEVAFFNNAVVIRYVIGDDFYFAYPISVKESTRVQVVSAILEDYKEARFIGIPAKAKYELETHFPGRFEIDECRDYFDYVYERERLASLAGKKLSAKRNHINRFKEKGDWKYEVIDESNLEECWNIELDWLAGLGDDRGESALHEKNALRFAIDNFKELELFGGLIRLDGRVVAFCIAERLNLDTCVVHFEKAYGEIQGAFQIINQQFTAHNAEFKYVNREDDLGDLGLRKAKLSYYPDILVSKYNAVTSEFTYATKADKEEVADLWSRSFGDSKEYVYNFFDGLFEENNILLYRKNGKLVSMTCLLDCTIVDGEECEDARYIYALCTDEDSRGMGYASELIRHIQGKCDSTLVLCLGEPELEAFYKQNGFEVFCGQTEWEESANAFSDEEITEIFEVSEQVVSDYALSRETLFANRLGVRWNNRFIRFALEDHLRAGGSILKFSEGYALVFKEADSARIVECTVLDRQQAVGAIAKFFKVPVVRYRNEECMKSGAKKYIKDGYLSLNLG